jgi:hypothetical protein
MTKLIVALPNFANVSITAVSSSEEMWHQFLWIKCQIAGLMSLDLSSIFMVRDFVNTVNNSTMDFVS